MALQHFVIATNSSTVTKILTLPRSNGATVRVAFQNNDASADIYIGTKDVTASAGARQGFKVAKGGTVLQLDLEAGDTLYAISNTGTPYINILWTNN